MLTSARTFTAALSGDALTTPSGDPFLALAVDTLKQGLLLFDASGHVVGLNAAAKRAIGQRPELSVAPSPEPPHDRLRLVVRRSAIQLKLERALRACATADSRSLCLQPTLSAVPRTTQALILTYDKGQPGLILQLSPMPAGFLRADPGQPAIVGALLDRASPPTLEPSILKDLFSLTEAESRVAEAYLTVDTVKDVAEMLGVSANTVKTHLAAVYLKTGCTRQAQLVRLLMSLSELCDDAQPGSGSLRDRIDGWRA